MKDKKESRLPKFLEKIMGSEKNQKIPEEDPVSVDFHKEIKKEEAKNPVSISAIFNKDSSDISGVRRVFRKSMIFLVISNLFFLLTTALSISFFHNILLTILMAIGFVVTTNIFFIIVADRSYVWISIATQALLGLIVYAFLGQAMSLVTIVATGLIVLFTYFAYSETEKVQLGSRLFSLSHIIKESSRILTSVVVMIISLGVFNGIMDKGSDKFISDFVFKNDFVADYLFIGKGPTDQWNLNKVFMADAGPSMFGYSEEEDFKPGTFFDYIEELYEDPKSNSLLTMTEIEQIEDEFDSELEDKKIAEEERIIAQNLADKHYPNIGLSLDSQLDGPSFRKVSEQYYVNKITDFETEKNDKESILPDFLKDNLLSREFILPGFIAILVFVVLTLLKFIINLVSFFVLTLVWNVLKSTGFVKIEVETVEAEVVSI